MSKKIDSGALIDRLTEVKKDMGRKFKFENVLETINDAPDATDGFATWSNVMEDGFKWARCSECDYKAPILTMDGQLVLKWEYCSNCGMRMVNADAIG